MQETALLTLEKPKSVPAQEGKWQILKRTPARSYAEGEGYNAPPTLEIMNNE